MATTRLKGRLPQKPPPRAVRRAQAVLSRPVTEGRVAGSRARRRSAEVVRTWESRRAGDREFASEIRVADRERVAGTMRVTVEKDKDGKVLRVTRHLHPPSGKHQKKLAERRAQKGETV